MSAAIIFNPPKIVFDLVKTISADSRQHNNNSVTLITTRGLPITFINITFLTTQPLITV